MKVLHCLMLLAAGAALAATPDAPSHYAATASVAVAGNEGLQRVSLPLAVLQQARSAELADVRVFNAAGEALPFAWAGPPDDALPAPGLQALRFFAWPGSDAAVASATSTAASTTAANASLPELKIELRSDGAVLQVERRGAAGAGPTLAPRAWLVDLQPLAGKPPTALLAQWRSEPKGFVRSARVQASRDAQQWQPVGQATLVDVPGSAGESAVTQRRIELAGVEREHRWLRLWLDAPIALAEVGAETGVPRPPLPMDHARWSLQADGERAWTLDAGGVLPVRRLQVHLAQANSVAPLQIEVRRPDARGREPDSWRPLAQLAAYRLVRDGTEVASPPLEVPTTAARHWRFVLDARAAGLGSGTPEVTLEWVAPQLVFAARGAGPYQLAVGRDNAARGALERATLMPGYRSGDEFRLAPATLGPLRTQRAAPVGAADRLAHASREDLQRWLLWAVLAAAVLGLAALAWRLAREMRERPERPGD